MTRRDNQDNTYWFYVLVKKETEKAVLLFDGHKTTAWCPKSQIVDMEGDLGEGVITKVEVKGWIVEEKGWETENSMDDFNERPRSSSVETPKSVRLDPDYDPFS